MKELRTKKKSIFDFVEVLEKKDVLTGKHLEQEQKQISRKFEEIRLEKMAFHAHSLQTQKTIFITC